MTNLQKELQFEISAFADAIQSEWGTIQKVSKADFCQAHKKLKSPAFVELSQIVFEKFYMSDQV